MSCEHRQLIEGPTIPLLYGSALSQICCDCGVYLVSDYYGKPKHKQYAEWIWIMEQGYMDEDDYDYNR